MANNKSYFATALAGVKTLLTGMDITMGEYVTPKITEQYPENRKTQHVAERHRGTLVMPHDENGKNKCTACTLCEKTCPNGSIKITSQMVETEDGKKKKVLVDYLYNLGDCMFCQLCVNACNFGAIEFRKDFENAVFNRDALALHLNIPPVLPEAKPKADEEANNKEA
jgi:NADH-quinone oxidoreductase subunit I